jgi:hypothetical protein
MFFYFVWPQAWSLIPLPEVYTLYGKGGGIRTRASGSATLPMSYSRPHLKCKSHRRVTQGRIILAEPEPPGDATPTLDPRVKNLEIEISDCERKVLDNNLLQ